MIPLEKITGRLGNKMFEFAALYSYQKERGLDYYCQDEDYFKKYKNDILSMFGSSIGYTPFASLHVRRGDYLESPQSSFHINLCTTDYYKKALSLFEKETPFLVFSDDIPWCKEYFTKSNFSDYSFQFAEGNDEITDMNMMASCSLGNIIANSTFSWWAAYLNPHPTKKVIAPKWWFYDKRERTKMPSEWTTIDFDVLPI